MAYYGYDERAAELMIDACSMADANTDVDFSKYDYNGDGYVHTKIIPEMEALRTVAGRQRRDCMATGRRPDLRKLEHVRRTIFRTGSMFM